MKEPTLEDLQKSKEENEKRIKDVEENYQAEIKELELIEKEIKENKNFAETTNVLEELCKKKGTPVNFVVYSKASNKLQKICNNEPLNISNEGMASSVKVGNMFFPLCGNDCIKEITDGKTGEILFANDYYNQSYHLQRAQTFGSTKAIGGVNRDKLSSFEFRNIMTADITKINESLDNRIKTLESEQTPAPKA